MKTIFLIRNIAPDCYGGAESYQIELAKILKKNDFCPIIFTASKKLLTIAKQNHIQAIQAPYIKRQNWSGWRNILLPIYIFWQFKLYFWYKKQIRKYSPTAINIQSRDEWISATIAARKTHTQVFWTDHADFRNWVFTNINIKYKNFIGKYILKLSTIPDKIITISDFEASWLRKNVKLPRNNIMILKNGVIDQKHDYDNIKPLENNFCYVGRIVDYKGISELIEAFNIISHDNPSATLHIYGDGPDYEKYCQSAKSNQNIHFYGYTKEPLKAMAQSEVFILPSYYEGLSISLLEASMMQKTIIATNVDGNPEVVLNDHTGFTIPPRDADALAHAMQKILDDKKLARSLAKNARLHYEQEFNFTHNVEQSLIPLLTNKEML